jgi:hypothetical protein
LASCALDPRSTLCPASQCWATLTLINGHPFTPLKAGSGGAKDQVLTTNAGHHLTLRCAQEDTWGAQDDSLVRVSRINSNLAQN